MISFALDENNDILMRDGQIQTIEGAEETVQHVQTRLQFIQGEWFLDVLAGVPYFTSFFVKPVNLQEVQAVITDTILSTPGVLRLTEELGLEYNETTRELDVSFSAETTYGSINQANLYINRIG